ncbi:MAG TPA: hypothetical protein P5572_16720 [Phycisphaerae bacterium]|nr:hypothetical protein [Phycisphaerales bacterium]HRX86669.1 hypothetical protein [Phycisphaerae bacterium]
MHVQTIAPFAEYAATLTRHTVRVINTADGHGLLLCNTGASGVRLQLAGRPDGVRPGGMDSTLDVLRAKIAGAVRIKPQDWMELDREYVLYQQRSRCTLSAAVTACQQGRGEEAMRLCRASREDAAHQAAIITLAAEAHPAGSLPGAGLANHAALLVQQCVAEALPCMIAQGPAAAVTRLRHGVTEITAALSAQGEPAAPDNASVRKLLTLATRLEADPSLTPQIPVPASPMQPVG